MIRFRISDRILGRTNSANSFIRLEKEISMNHPKRWLGFILAAIVVLTAAWLATSFIACNYLVDLWWFKALGYEFYFMQRLLYRYVVFFSVTALFFLIFFLNFWVASGHLGTTAPPAASLKGSGLQGYKHLFKMFRTGSMWVYTPLSLVLAIVVAEPLFEKWETFLLYVFQSSTGVHEPAYGKDIAYYLFSFPIYSLLQRRLLIAFGVLLLGLVVLYFLERRILKQQDERLPEGARWHVSILVLLTFFIEIWDFVLQRYELLYTNHHMPLFSGPGYVEMKITLPLIWLSMVLLAGTAFSLAYSVHNRRGLKIFAAFAVLFALALGVRYSSFLPDTVQKFLVKPNEISKERPFIESNIKATLAAYNLQEVEVRDFSPEKVPTDISDPTIKAQLRNIPVWDGDLLDDVYKQLQQLRTYYTFQTVHVGRYDVNGIYQQVFLAARELDHQLLPEGARNWVNDHLSYTHGYGAVMTPAGQGGDEPMTWFLRGIPPESDYGFKIDQPGIYYGLEPFTYAIAPNAAGEIDYPKGNSNVMTSYSGKGGVPVSSLFKKMVFAFYFGDKNILFTGKTEDKSKILFRQNIVERIKTLTPYLLLDKDPYLAIAAGKLYWIQDAYTTSDWYPYSTEQPVEGGNVNYIRNSVKIVVNAYDGSVDYYVFDPKDPIIRSYSRIYPGLFKDRAQMPKELVSQVRYPEDIFTIQMKIYANYHQTDPEVFYQQEDIWEFAKTYQDKESVKIRPYYLTLDLMDPQRLDFLLLLPMSPKGRDNLRALPLVGCDPPHYGRILVYNFPKGELIYGPSQIYALINQDTKVSEQFTLWDQIGSQVARGRMIILPIGKIILYIQPVYLKSATSLKIPELKRLIMSEGQTVVMEPSLEEAYAKMLTRVKTEIERVDKRFAPLMPKEAPAGEPGKAPEQKAAPEAAPPAPHAAPADQHAAPAAPVAPPASAVAPPEEQKSPAAPQPSPAAEQGKSPAQEPPAPQAAVQQTPPAAEKGAPPEHQAAPQTEQSKPETPQTSAPATPAHQ